MFDNKGMQKLRHFIDAEIPRRTDQEWADSLGISRSHFTMLKNGTAQPGKTLMTKIAAETGGAVPVTVWFDDAPAQSDTAA